jgi:hypothetical protein
MQPGARVGGSCPPGSPRGGVRSQAATATSSPRSPRHCPPGSRRPRRIPPPPAPVAQTLDDAADTPESTPVDKADPMSYRNRPRRKRHELDEIRNWLYAQGYSKEQVPEYGGGGIPDWAVFAFEQAHPEKATRDWTKLHGQGGRSARAR